MTHQPDWTVLLIGGPSGTGKSRLAYPLARQLGRNLFEVDDLQVVLEKMLSPDQFPKLHYWRTHWPEYSQWTEERQLQHFIEVSREFFLPALEAIIAHHLEAGTGIIIEGDFLLPELAVRTEFEGVPAQGRVRAVFVTEEEQHIQENYLQREGHAQPERAHSSFLFGEWLKQECLRLEIPTLNARPWEDGVERALKLL